MQKKFKSVLFDLPPEVRAEVDNLIDQDYSGLAIYNSLREKFQNIKIPTLPTILRYIRYYRVQKQNIKRQLAEEKILCNFESGLAEINSVLIQISRGKDPIFNKIRLLEGLVGKCMQRITALENLEVDRKSNQNVDNIIIRYISEVKSIVDIINKLSGNNAYQDEKILIQLIRNEAKGVLEAVREIVLEICPEKYDLFKEKLLLKLQSLGLHTETRIDEVPELSSSSDSVSVSEPQVIESIPEKIIPENIECKT